MGSVKGKLRGRASAFDPTPALVEATWGLEWPALRMAHQLRIPCRGPPCGAPPAAVPSVRAASHHTRGSSAVLDDNWTASYACVSLSDSGSFARHYGFERGTTRDSFPIVAHQLTLTRRRFHY